MRRVCVFLGSNPGNRPAYAQSARDLGAALAQRGVGLVYGGSDVGCMAELADACLAAGGEVIGVIPKALVDKEVAHAGLTEQHVVASMHERKAKMAELADGFIALPGGLGTLEELFEVFTWAQLGFHTKPCGLLNAGGYYDTLLSFLDHMVTEGFVRPAHRQILQAADNPAALLDLLAAYRPAHTPKWVQRADL